MAAQLDAFLNECLPLLRTYFELNWEGRRQTLLYSVQAVLQGRSLEPGQERQWQDFTGMMLARHPEADRLALQGMIRHAEREKAGQRLAAPQGSSTAGTLLGLLAAWVLRRPTPDAADQVLRSLEELLGLTSRTWLGSLLGGSTGSANLKKAEASVLARTLARLDRREEPPYPRSKPLMLHLIERHLQLKGRLDEPSREVLDALLADMAPYLNQTPAVVELTETVLLAAPIHLRRAPGGEALQVATDRVVARALAAEPHAEIHTTMTFIGRFAGFDQFLSACRQLDRYPQVKRPLPGDSGRSDPDACIQWPVSLLLKLPPPGPADESRAGELNQVSRATLLLVAVLAPRWVGLIEPHLDWPGLGALISWCHQCGQTAAWRWESTFLTDQPGDEEELEGGLDRTLAMEAAALMGPKRLSELTKLPAFRRRYREALVCLLACLGENGADVEAGFAKRNKTAVRALGLLPDEDDVLDRYLALRRFAKEARQFGPQRQASETKAAEDGLDNLALTAGYSDRAALEWAMEAKLAESVDPTSRRWVIEGYTVWLEPDEKATVAVEREGKRLKNVPPAVRQSPEYSEVKEAREQLQAQWDRVLRRLESSMARGEVMDRATFAPAFTTPAGRAMVPGLVLRCWLPGSDNPVEALNLTRLDGTPVAPDTVERYQVAHPLQLAAAGTLEAWQRRLVDLGVTQPFAQLFREMYSTVEARRQVAGRQVRLGALVERLKRSGWKREGEGDLVRPLGRRKSASLWFSDGASWMEATAVLTVDQLHLPDEPLDPLLLSEVIREADLATAHACPDKSLAPESREALAARTAFESLRPKTKGSRRIPV